MAAVDALLDKVVASLKENSKIIVLSGAGMSTAAGIPDFRSPGGLYGTSATLLEKFTYLGDEAEQKQQRKELTQDVKAALTLRLFKRNPLAYHEMRRGLIIGLGENQWKYTLGHVFPEILNRNGKLRLLASQNIDGLDHKVISDRSKLFNPHGLMSILVSEPLPHREPIAVGVNDPVYQKYVQLVKDNIKDIYADRPARQGNSSLRFPGPPKSTPITLDMFGDLLPGRFHAARDREKEAAEKGQLLYSVKPASVLFDGYLWQTKADGSDCDWMAETATCDMMFVMGTSLSGLTIDSMAHAVARTGKDMVVLDMTDAPVKSIGSAWNKDTHCFLQSPIDKSVLQILHRMGWLQQLFDHAYLPDLCIGSLQAVKEFLEANQGDIGSLQKVSSAIEAEMERERQLYGE